jgi:hypothetical protein
VALPLHPQKSLFDFARAKNIAAGSKAQVNFTISQRLGGQVSCCYPLVNIQKAIENGHL